MRALEIGLSFALALAAPVALSAHEGHAHKVMGVVSAVDAERVEVATSDGRKVTLGLNAQTRYKAGDEPAVAADVKVGGRVVVTAAEQEGKTVASEVLLPPKQGEGSDR